VSDNPFEFRREAISAGLAARQLDALLVGFGANLRYLSGFTGSNAALLVLKDSAILFTDPRYTIQASQEVACQVHIARGHLIPEAMAAATGLRVRRIGFDAAQTTCESFDIMQSRLPARASLRPVAGWVEALRMVKSAAEIALIRRSVETNSLAFEQTVKHVKSGTIESDIAAELEYRMRRLGAEKASFETIVASGARSALPHANPTTARLEKGDLVVIDMGALEGGYCSDMTRMLFVGTPGPKVKRMYKAVLEAQLAAIAAVRAGVTTAHVDLAARRVLKGYGLENEFIHSTGHGLGLEIHELPRIGKKDKTRLATGMAITIEPGVYVEGFGGIRIEDTVVVTPHGCDILTPTPKGLHLV
jgi:Xaa-Pro aminopeptidase